MANNKQVLLCGLWDSPHLSVLAKKLEQLGIGYYWFSSAVFPKETHIAIRPDDNSVDICVSGKPVLTSTNISVVVVQLWRYQKHLHPENWEIERYNDYEANSFLSAFYALSSQSSYWLNDLDAEQKASLKPYQLHVAKQLGFTIPNSVIGNDPHAVTAFLETHPLVILKPLHQGGIATQDNQQAERDEYTSFRFLTQQFTPEQLQPFLANFEHCPVIVQEYIPKQLELRITVIGEQLFACAIDSQASEKSAIDWRNYDLENTPYTPYELPDEIKHKCFQLLKTLKLDIGAIDMILTPESDYVFLEINPSFAWLWIEKLTGMPITDTLVALIAEKHAAYSI